MLHYCISGKVKRFLWVLLMKLHANYFTDGSGHEGAYIPFVKINMYLPNYYVFA